MNTEWIRQRISALKGRIGVYREDLASGESSLILHGTEQDSFEAASMIKLWIMSCAFKQAASGNLSMEEHITLREEDQVPAGGLLDYRRDQLAGCLTTDMFPESGVLNLLHKGLELTVRDLIRLMIVISDNTATNMLIDRLGIRAINEHIQCALEEPQPSTRLVRRLFDADPAGLGRENTIGLRETAAYFRLLHEGRLVSEDASLEMLAILQNQQTTWKIPFYIQHLPIAHKTGEDIGICNDAGIVYAEHPFILCFAANQADTAEAARACQEIARTLAR